MLIEVELGKDKLYYYKDTKLDQTAENIQQFHIRMDDSLHVREHSESENRDL